MAGDRRTLRTSVPVALFYALARQADAEELPLGELACRVLEESVPGWREMPAFLGRPVPTYGAPIPLAPAVEPAEDNQ